MQWRVRARQVKRRLARPDTVCLVARDASASLTTEPRKKMADVAVRQAVADLHAAAPDAEHVYVEFGSEAREAADVEQMMDVGVGSDLSAPYRAAERLADRTNPQRIHLAVITDLLGPASRVKHVVRDIDVPFGMHDVVVVAEDDTEVVEEAATHRVVSFAGPGDVVPFDLPE